MKSLFSWLGVIAGGVSVFRLCHLWFAFDLSVPAHLVLSFYKQFFHQFVDWMAPFILAALQWLHLYRLPDGWQDFLIVYVVIFFAMVRFLRSYYFFRKGIRRSQNGFDDVIGATGFEVPRMPPAVLFLIDCVISLFWPVLPILYVVASIATLNDDGYRTRVLATLGGWVLEISKVLAVGLLFVATNAAATSL